MASSARHPHLATPAELQQRIRVERGGEPFLIYRDGHDKQHIVALSEGAPLRVGREAGCDVCVDWDARVSSLHAELHSSGREWLVVDDGLSRNGTYLNGERVDGRRRLRDGDQLELGRTVLVFRDPRARQAKSTEVAGAEGRPPELSPAQRRVLVALCRPYAGGVAFARPATNQQIAEELFLSIPAVKTHLRSLFERFALGDLPQNEKRARLVQAALDSGAVTSADLVAEP
jgi:pSer/pThr/pTyr-binding forkhead associated (FHA) protein